MGNKQTFHCWNCGENNEYLHQAEERSVVYGLETVSDEDKTRTYYCENCGQPNEIELKGSAWKMIDS